MSAALRAEIAALVDLTDLAFELELLDLGLEPHPNAVAIVRAAAMKQA